MSWRETVRHLRQEARALRLACQDARTPWYARWLAVATVAYAVSPVDLIPDFIPVLGQLDDVVVLPLAFWVTLRLVPRDVMAECRTRARTEVPRDPSASP